MSKTKIIHIITGLGTGGAEMVLYRLLQACDRTVYEPSVITLIGEEAILSTQIAALDIPVYSLGLAQGNVATTGILHLIRLLRKIRPAIIQGWMYHGNFAAQMAQTALPGTHVIWGVHHSLYNLSYEKPLTAAIVRVSAALSRLPAQIVYVSHTSQRQHRALGFYAGRDCVIPNGFDTTAFTPSHEARIKVRSELGLPMDTLLIGNIGRYHPQKDHANFLRSAALLNVTHPDIHFLLAGPGVHRQNDTLHQLIMTLGLKTRVHLLGERHDAPNLMASLDILTSSSAYGESLSLVVGEAMACGIPCVVTDLGDNQRMLGAAGIMIPPQDSAALARAWSQLIAAGPESRRALGTLARIRIQRDYSIEGMVHQYESLYGSLVTQLRAGSKHESMTGVL